MAIFGRRMALLRCAAARRRAQPEAGARICSRPTFGGRSQDSGGGGLSRAHAVVGVRMVRGRSHAAPTCPPYIRGTAFRVRFGWERFVRYVIIYERKFDHEKLGYHATTIRRRAELTSISLACIALAELSR